MYIVHFSLFCHDGQISISNNIIPVRGYFIGTDVLKYILEFLCFQMLSISNLWDYKGLEQIKLSLDFI